LTLQLFKPKQHGLDKDGKQTLLMDKETAASATATKAQTGKESPKAVESNS
jgi:hypothetical protein